MLDNDTAAAAPAPAAGHFRPKNKPPSAFTKAVLRKAKQALPLDDTRDFDEQRQGLIAPTKDVTIQNGAGDVVWDLTQFQFLDQTDEFDTVHPSMHRIGKLNNNSLYDVIPGIYQVCGLDLAQTTFVRGKTGSIVFDCPVTTDAMRAAWKPFQEHKGEGLPVTAVISSHSHGDHWGGVWKHQEQLDLQFAFSPPEPSGSTTSRPRPG